MSDMPIENNSLGEAKTVGELRKKIEPYPDETSFGFRNQPMQELFEVKMNETFIVFDYPHYTFPPMTIVNDYYGKVDLKHKIIIQYVDALKVKREILQSALDDPQWASTDSDFHKNCRAELKEEVERIDQQIKLLP